LEFHERHYAARFFVGAQASCLRLGDILPAQRIWQVNSIRIFTATLRMIQRWRCCLLISSMMLNFRADAQHFSTADPGLFVRGCLDECDICEDAGKKEIELDLEHKRLLNKKLSARLS